MNALDSTVTRVDAPVWDEQYQVYRVTLKLTGVIAWSWLWVLLPFWGPIALAVILVFVAAAVASKR